MIGFASFVGGCMIVAYLMVEPNRWVAIAFASLGLLMQWRAIVQAGAEDPARLTNGEGS